MRPARHLTAVALATLLAACGGGGGGGDDKAESARPDSPLTIKSDDGSASLSVPATEDAGGISLTRAMGPTDSALAYDLAPSGRTFQEPVTLTIEGAQVPFPGALPVVTIESDDGTTDVLDSEVVYEGEGTTATVIVEVPHFSLIHAYWPNPATAERDEIADLFAYLPEELVVGSDVRLPVRFQNIGAPPESGVRITTWRWRGSLASTNATPAAVDDFPAPRTVDVTDQVATTVRCTKVGTSSFRYAARIDVDYVLRAHGVERKGSYSTRVRTTVERPCVAELTKPVVTQIRSQLDVPVTTYTVTAADPLKYALEYEWQMTGETCGTPRAPWVQQGQTVRWSHADAHPDLCAHGAPDHAVQVSVKVTTVRGSSVTCTIDGSGNKVIDNPTCA